MKQLTCLLSNGATQPAVCPLPESVSNRFLIGFCSVSNRFLKQTLRCSTRVATLLLVMLMSVNMWGADKTVSWTAAKNALGSAISSVGSSANGTIKTGDFEWSYTRTLSSLKSSKSDYVAMTGSYMQLGSSNAGESITFTTSNIPGTIKSVNVLCGGSSHTGSIMVGTTSYKSGNLPSWNGTNQSGSNYGGTGTASGTITITFSVSSNAALYIKTITIVYEEAAAVPVTSLILSEAGTETDYKNGKNVGDKYPLPTTCNQSCGDKTFVGWSTGEVNSPTEPTSNFYAPGEEVTLAANNTFYAVFADESASGSASGTDQINKSDWGSQGTQTSGSVMSVTTTNGIIVSCTKGYYGGTNAYAQFYGGDVITVTPVSGMTITQIVLTANGTNNNGWQSSGKITSEVGTISGSTEDKVTTWSGSSTSAIAISHDKQIRMSTISVVFGGGKSYSNYTTTCSSSSCSIEPELMIDEAISKTTADEDFSLEVLSENVGDGQTIVLNSSNTNVATIVDGKIHIVGAGTTDITASVAADGDYCSAISNACRLTVSKAKYTVTWMASGFEFAKNENVEDGSALTLPSSTPTSSDCDDKKIFRGWTTQAEYSHATAAPPDMFTTAGNKKVTGNVTYYAVFSDATPGGAPVTATLSATGLSTGTYKTGTKNDDNSNQWSYYAAVTNLSGTLYYGLNSNESNYNIGSPKFAGNITAISLKTYNGSSTEDRKFYLCSSNTTAQPSSGDIAELTISKSESFSKYYDADLSKAGAFSQFYIYAAKALGVSEVKVTYSPITYSNYTTVCTPPTYSITFDGNGATSGEMSKIENIAKGGSQKITKNAFEKIGYSFTGWKDQDNNPVADEANITNITKNITLTAQWEANTIYVNLDKNGSSEDGLVTVVYDATSVEEVVHVADWAAHELQGYFTESTGGSKVLNADGTFAGNVAGWIVDGKWAQTEEATLYAQWLAQQKCTFTDYDLDGCTADPNNVTEVDVNAEGVTLNYILADNHTWTGTETVITMGTADLTEGTDYTFITGTITFLIQITGNINVMVSCPWAPATLTLSAIEHEYSFGEGLKVNDEITLPSTVNYQASGKTFVGWSSETIPSEGSMPTTKYWAKGANYTIQTATDKLYAVYATENKGAESWVIATGIDVLHDGDKVAFTSAKGEQNYASAGRSYTNEFLNCFLDPVEITLEDNVVTSGAENIVPITLGGNATDGWTMYMDDYGYIVGSYALNKDGNKQSNTTLFSNTPKVIQGISINTYTYEATVKVSGDSVMRYNSNSPRFSIYNNTQTAIKLLKQKVDPSTFEKYTTSGFIYVDAPTFDDLTKPGTFTDADHLVIINVPTSATVHYTLNGDDPTEASATYDENDGITLTATATIKAKAFIEGIASDMLEGTFTIHNYNSVAALINGAEHNKAAVLNLNEVYVLGVYATANQIFVQEGSKGAIITLSDAVPEGIKAGVKLTANVSGTYIFTAHNRPQMNGCTLSNISTFGENQRPASIPVLGAIDATTAADNLLTLVQINNVYSVSKSYNDIVMNSASDETGTSYNVNNLLSAVKNTLPEKELACNVIGIFYKKISNNVEEYSIVPVLESDFATASPQLTILPTLDVYGGAEDSPLAVAPNKQLTFTRVEFELESSKYKSYYQIGTSAPVEVTAKTTTITLEGNNEDIVKLKIYSTRPYYTTNEAEYFYKIDESKIEYDITYSGVQSYVGVSGAKSACAGAIVELIGTRKVEHYYPGDVTVTQTGDESVTIDVTRTEVTATEATYSFEMPPYPVTVKIGYTKDPTYEVKYNKGGQNVSGSDPSQKSYYEDDEVTIVDNPWTRTNYVFNSWKVQYNNGEEDVIITPVENKFNMPPFPVTITAQWTPTYTVTYLKGDATSATGEMSEEPQIEGAVITLKANAFKATGYSFTGWKASTGEQIYQPGAEFTMPAQAVTFTAQWDAPIYTKPGAWELVTDPSELAIGDYIIFAAKKDQTWYAGSSKTKNANQNLYTETNVSVTDDILTYIEEEGKDINDHIFQIEEGNENNTYAFYNEKTNKYLYALGTSDKNYLKMNDTKTSANASWTISSIADGGEAVVNANCTYKTRLSINTNVFSCYGSKQTGLQIYKFYQTARKVYFSANAGEDVVTDMPEMQRADPSTNEVTIPNVKPKRTGYTFTKWNSAQNGTGTRSAQPGETIELWQAKCTLHAIWTLTPYKIAVESVDYVTIKATPYGETDITEGTNANVNYKKKVVLSYRDLDEAYVFKSWKVTKADDENVNVPLSVGISSTTFEVPAYDVKVSAVIEDKASAMMTVTYHANGGKNKTEGDPDDVSADVQYNKELTFTADNCPFEKELCNFVGWNTKADGTGITYATNLIVTTNIDLYAMWQGTGVTYRLDKLKEGNIYEYKGAAPQGATVTYNNTNPSSNVDQATQGNTITITLSDYDGWVIKNITVDIKTNGGSAASLDIAVGGNSIFNKNYVDLEAGTNTGYFTCSLEEYGFSPFIVKDNEDIVLTAGSTNNSAYIQNITIEYCEPEILRDELTVEHYTTICLPKTIPAKAYTGATFWNIENKTTMTDGRLSSITIVQHEGDLEAGVPYIMYNTASEFKCYQTGEAVDAPEGNNGLVGVFEDTPFDNVADDAEAAQRGIYIISDGTLYLCGNNCGVYANRAYIKNSEIEDQSAQTPPAAPRRTIGAPRGTATGLFNNVLRGNDDVMKVIRNNQLYIIKNGRTYNAQGAWLK